MPQRSFDGLLLNAENNKVFLTPQMLLNLHKKSWMEGLTLQDYSEHCKLNETIVKEMLELAKNYNKVQELILLKFNHFIQTITRYFKLTLFRNKRF